MAFFDGSDVDERDYITEGKYKAIVLGAELKDNSTNTGSYVQVVFQVLDDSKHEVLSFYNIEHENVQAEKIGKKQFKKLVVAATGGVVLEKLEHLIDRKVSLELGVRTHEGRDMNFVVSVEPFGASDDTPF